MKRTIALLISLIMVFAFVPFSAFSVGAETFNVAYGKSYDAVGYYSYGEWPCSYNANLTDGIAYGDISFEADDWFAFCTSEGENGLNAPDGIGSVVIDLEQVYDISSVYVSALVGDNIDNSGISGPKRISVYVSDYEYSDYVYVGDMYTYDDYGATWFALSADVAGRYVKIEVELNGIFAFINEVEVYAEETVEEDVEEIINAFDMDISAPDYYYAGEEVVVTVTVNNVNSLIHCVSGALYFDPDVFDLESALVEDRELSAFRPFAEWEDYTAIRKDLYGNWYIELFALTGGYYDDYGNYVYTDYIYDGDLVFDVKFIAKEDAAGDAVVSIPNDSVFGAYVDPVTYDVSYYTGNGSEAVIYKEILMEPAGSDEPEEPMEPEDSDEPEDPGEPDGVYSEIYFSENELVIEVNKSKTITATVNGSVDFDGPVDWVVDDPSVATVTANGTSCTITAVGEGSTKVYAYIFDGTNYAVADITVVPHFHKNDDGVLEMDSENHWKVCDECGEIYDVAAHKFDDVFDAYCNEEACSFVRATGDINESDSLDSMDYMYLKRAYFSQYPLADKALGDIDYDGDLDSMDYLFLKRAYFSQYVIIEPVNSPDDFIDKEDTGVTEGDKSVLTASTTEVLANSGTVVTFYVNSTLTVPYFELYANGEPTGVYLYDNGDYYGSNDDIPNDGCYTGEYQIDYITEGDVAFSAKAIAGDTFVVTNEMEMFVYYELTDEQCWFMDNVVYNIETCIEGTRALLAGETNPLIIAQATASVLDDYLSGLEEEGSIVNVSFDESYCTVSFEYAETGISSIIAYYTLPSADSSLNITNKNTDITVELPATNNGAASLDDIDLDYVTYKEKALFMLYCDEYASYYEEGAGYLLVNSSKSIANKLQAAGFDTELRYNITVDDFKTLHEYQYIRIGCHGSYLNDTPYICTDDAVDNWDRKAHSADLKKQRVLEAITVDEYGNLEGPFYWIHPDFFTHYYAEDPLKANIVHVSCCQGAYDSDLVDALLSAGADSVVAFDETVYTQYDCDLMEVMIPELLKGDSVEEALNDATEKVGYSDIEWFYSNWPDEIPKSEVAICLVFGDENTVLHDSIVNGDFDAPDDLYGNKVSDWKMYGDSRSIFKLSGIEPTTPSKMAIISSGFGSLNNQTTSCIYQTILVPEGATSLKFSYDVVSEEPMEYVGSKYNDIFRADILNLDGEVLENLSYESVNTSTWYAIDGVNFPGGDDTTYHTRWNHVETDAISEYSGQLVVIRFAVQDTGDSVYDTAAIIDSVVIE